MKSLVWGSPGLLTQKISINFKFIKKIFPLIPVTPSSLSIRNSLSKRPFPLGEVLGELPVVVATLLEYAALQNKEYRNNLEDFAKLEKTLRLRKMYVAGGVAASLATHFIHGRRQGWRDRMVYARLFSLWANYLILADAASDQRELGLEASRSLLQYCLAEIFSPLVAQDQSRQEILSLQMDRHLGATWPVTVGSLERPPSPAGRVALILAGLFGEQAALCLGLGGDRQGLSRRFALFSARVLALLAGQGESLHQMADEARDQWVWYCEQVLDAKFSNILFAPLVLLGHSDKQDRQREVLERGLKLINALYLHRQLLDDLLDLERDCLDGILAGPAFLLVAVGQERSPSAGPNFPQADTLCALPEIISHRLAAQGPEALQGERAASQAFQVAWRRDRQEAARILQKSQMVATLLQILVDPGRIAPVERQIQNLLAQEPGAAAALKYYQYRCARTFRKVQANFDL